MAAATATATALSPSGRHWRVTVSGDITPTTVVSFAALRIPEAGRIVGAAFRVSSLSGGATSITPSLSSLASPVDSIDTYAAWGAITADERATIDPPAPYAALSGSLRLHPGLDAGTARLDAEILIVAGWAA